MSFFKQNNIIDEYTEYYLSENSISKIEQIFRDVWDLLSVHKSEWTRLAQIIGTDSQKFIEFMHFLRPISSWECCGRWLVTPCIGEVGGCDGWSNCYHCETREEEVGAWGRLSSLKYGKSLRKLGTGGAPPLLSSEHVSTNSKSKIEMVRYILNKKRIHTRNIKKKITDYLVPKFKRERWWFDKEEKGMMANKSFKQLYKKGDLIKYKNPGIVSGYGSKWIFGIIERKHALNEYETMDYQEIVYDLRHLGYEGISGIFPQSWIKKI